MTTTDSQDQILLDGKESKTKTQKTADFEEIWSVIGGFGRYAMLLTLFMWYMTIVVVFHQFIQTYYGTPPNYRCISIQPNSTSTCGINQCGCSNCTYVFDKAFTSAVTEWNLICDRAHFRAMTQSVYSAGVLVGSVAFGVFSDRFGRRITTFLSLFLMAAFGLGSAFSPNLIMFAVMRFGSGFCTGGGLIVKFVYCMEICPLGHRTAMGVLSNLFVVIGGLLLTLIAYLIRDWRYLMMATTLAGIPPLVFWRWVPESPYWLIAKGRLKEAQKVLESFAAANRVKVDPKELSAVIRNVKNAEVVARSTHAGRKAGFLDLVRTPKMRKRTLILSYNWFVNSVVFYGITLNAKNLGGSFHLNVFILTVVGIPSVLTLWVVIQRLGRRVGYCGYMLLGSLICLLVLAVPTDNPNEVHPAVKCLAVFGVFCIAATFSTVYIYSSELSPTLLRHLSMGVGSMMSRFGGIIAPYIVFLNDYMQNLPLVVFGIVGFIAGLSALLLPETLYSPMPQTVEQVEAWTEDYRLPCRKRVHRPEEYIPGENDLQGCPDENKEQENTTLIGDKQKMHTQTTMV